MVFNSLPKDWAGARRPRIFFIVLIFFCSMAGVGECAQLFYTQFLPVEGATLSAAPADLDGKVLTTPSDLNGDGYADVIVTLTKGTGKFLDRRINIFIFLHRQKSNKPYPPQPDQTIIVEGITSGVNLEDVNGDGREDMYLSSVRVGFWKIVKNLLSKRAGVETAVFLLQSDNRYSKKPDYEKETSYRLNLTRGVKFRGAFPTLEGDFNGDGEKDLLIARDEKIEIHARNSNGDFFLKPVSQSNVFTSVYRHITDLNGDGRDDLIFYEKKRGGRISVSLNRMQPSME